MYFIGIDLAWSKNNGSGVAILNGDSIGAELINYSIRYSNEDILEYILDIIQDNDAIISIDAPLIVPNNEGRRPAEAEIGRLFRKFNAGAYPSNRVLFNKIYGGIRGEELSLLLENKGFIQNPYLGQFQDGKYFFEVYPHPSMCVLFNLEKILRYKPKAKRDYETRYSEFEKYINHLLKIKDLIITGDLLKTDFRKLKSKKLKNFEDTLDGIFCAYLSYYFWKNSDKCKCCGDLEKGYIVTPIFDYMKQL